jgi:hypothetical protein
MAGIGLLLYEACEAKPDHFSAGPVCLSWACESATPKLLPHSPGIKGPIPQPHRRGKSRRSASPTEEPGRRLLLGATLCHIKQRNIDSKQ